MRLLLDTHALLWFFLDAPQLTESARIAIEDNDAEVFVSAVSAMEISTKFRIGKLPEAANLAQRFEAMCAAMQLEPLSISLAHANLAGALPISHKDPFDRLLIAQAQIEGMTLVSNESLFDGFGIVRLW